MRRPLRTRQYLESLELEQDLDLEENFEGGLEDLHTDDDQRTIGFGSISRGRKPREHAANVESAERR
jgi:hypothetical protein